MRRLATGLFALACYGALVTYLTWPLVPNAATHLPRTAYACRFDSLYSGWTLAHQTTALLTDPTRLAQGNNFHPASDTIFYGPAGSGALPYFAPVFAITGNPTLALNFTFLFSVVLTAWTMHLVVRHWAASHLAGAVAACSFLLTRWTLWEWLPTTPHVAVLQYFPLIVLLATEPAAGWRRNLALLALVVLQCLTDLVYVAPAVLVPLAVLGAARLARRRTRAAGAALLGTVTLAALLLLIPTAGHLRVRSHNPTLERQAYWPIDPDWFRKNGTRIPSGLFARQSPIALPAAALALIGAGALVGASSKFRERRGWRSAALWAALGILMSLTPTVRWGDRAIDLPHALLAEWVPLYRHVRVPSRLGVAALVGLAMLAGLGFARCARFVGGFQRLRGAEPLVGALLAAVVFAGMFAQYRVQVGGPSRPGLLAPVYRIAPAIAPDSPFLALLRQPGGPLLELPARLKQRAWAPVWNARAMYRSIFHQRSILNGYASYWPTGFPERMTLADRLPDRAALVELRRQTGVELVWVHAGELAAPARKPWIALAEGAGRDDLRLIARDGDELLFAAGPG